jgi:hypothetical protein
MLDLGQLIDLGASLGVIIGIIFLVVELRQNNRFLAAQARYTLRQFRSDIADSLIQPNVLEATYKWGRGEQLTDIERGTGLMVTLKLIELWEWQYGEFAAGMLPRSDLPVGAWRLWYHGKGPTPMPIEEVYEARKTVLNPAFVKFFQENVISSPP